eukprot:XP_011449635.1 PREDICTED: uncharacterized protein LOC105343838 [Crassostrea gigas]
MGQHGKGVINENGQLFVDFYAENNLVIGGTIFPHKNINNTTLVSPDHRTENQIDHICISAKFRRSLDVRAIRGADAAFDHFLVVGKLKLRLKKCMQNNSRMKYDVERLKDCNTIESFKLLLQNKYQILQDHHTEDYTVESSWINIKELINTVCEEGIGKKKKNKPWISQKTLEKIEERRKIHEQCLNAKTRSRKAKYETGYKTKHREVKRSVKDDKRRYYEDLAIRAEAASEQRNMKEVYDITRQLSGKSSKSEKPVKDKNGNTLSTMEEQRQRWTEHFRELLNSPAPETMTEIQPAAHHLAIDCSIPSINEIIKAIKMLKNGKSPDPDLIPAEALKADP